MDYGTLSLGFKECTEKRVLSSQVTSGMIMRTFTMRLKVDDESVQFIHKQNIILLRCVVTDQTSENKQVKKIQKQFKSKSEGMEHS